MLAMVVSLNSIAARKGKRVPMHRSIQSIQALLKQKRTLAREQVVVYQDGNILTVEVLGEFAPTLFFRNEDGDIVFVYVMTQREEQMCVPSDACVLEVACGEYSLIGDLD